MTYEITKKTLWESQRGFLGWAIGLAGAAAIYTGSYLLIDPVAYQDVLDSFPTGLVEAFGWTDIASPEGYLGSTVYGLVVPILLAIFAIGIGARYLAGDEESGTMEMTMTHPVSRVSLALQRSLAATVACLGGAAIVLVVVLLLNGPVGLDVPMANLVAANLQLGLLGVVLATFTIAVGGLIGRRAIAIGAAAVVTVIGYLGDTFLPTIEGLGWLENLSVFHYYGGATVMKEGLAVGDTLVLIGLAALFVFIGTVAFSRRDVGTS